MNYYNENDPFAVAWLRQLIRAGCIPAGVVDERSITEVSPDDLDGFSQCHFFAGIGGWAEALRLAEWPPARQVWTASCPCQPFSVAGRRRGARDARHLWPVLRKLISVRRPAVVFGEQVESSDGRQWLAGVFADLARMDYLRAGADLCAAGLASPHRRQRLFWVGYAADFGRRCFRGKHPEKAVQKWKGRAPIERPGREYCGLANGDGLPGSEYEPQPRRGKDAIPPDAAVGSRAGRVGFSSGGNKRRAWKPEARKGIPVASGRSSAGHWDNFDLVLCLDGKARRIEPGTFPLADGLPGRVGALRGYGNAIVPQVASVFIRAVLADSHYEAAILSF